MVPVGYGSQYPYSKDGRMPGGEKAPIPDPIVALAYAAAISKRVRLATGIVILPQRHPAYVAKEFASLDVLSRGRAILGIGIGWLAEEFAVIGVPFRERAARTEESVRAIRSLWADAPKPFDGRFYRWNAVESYPKPVQKPGVPIVVGGHVEGAARRAARIGDGFFPAKGGLKELPGLLDAMRDECKKLGRKPETIEITTTGSEPRRRHREAIRRPRRLAPRDRSAGLRPGGPAARPRRVRRTLHRAQLRRRGAGDTSSQTHEGHPAQNRRCDLHLVEAGLPQELLELDRGTQVVHGARQAGAGVGVVGPEPDQEHPALPQHAPNLAQLDARVRPEVEHVHCERRVEARGLEGQPRSLGVAHVDLAPFDLPAQPPACQPHHHVRGVDPRYEPSALATGELLEIVAGPTADLEHIVMWLRSQLRERVGVGRTRLASHHPGGDLTEPARGALRLTRDPTGFHRGGSASRASARRPSQ